MDLPSPAQLPGGQGTARTGRGLPAAAPTMVQRLLPHPAPPPARGRGRHQNRHLPPSQAGEFGSRQHLPRPGASPGPAAPNLPAGTSGSGHPLETFPKCPWGCPSAWPPHGTGTLRHHGDTSRTARAPAARRASSARPLPSAGIPSPAPGREQAATAQLLRACRGPRGRTWREGGGKGQDADGTMQLPAQVAGGGRMRGCLRPRLWLPSAREGTMASHQCRGHRECGRGEAEPPAPLPASPRAPRPGYTQEAALVLSTTRRQGQPRVPPSRHLRVGRASQSPGDTAYPRGAPAWPGAS
ncbi:unnamed protein product, partial [Coccothraustes coccothraustes]